MNSMASGHIPRIGILSPATEPGMRDWWKEFTQGLNELGYVEGSNVELVWRFANGNSSIYLLLRPNLQVLELM